jgi:hypothetical protein
VTRAAVGARTWTAGLGRAAASWLRTLGALLHQAQQAADDPNAALAGAGPNLGGFPAAADEAVSPELARIRSQLAHLPDGWDPWTYYFDGADTDQQRAEWIANNQPIINAAAAETGLPPDLIAGVAWIEVGGKGYVFDDLTALWRGDPNPFKELVERADGHPDETSYGPLAIQVRRAAETLGYDPNQLTEEQSDQVVAALKDPGSNIFIAAKHLEYLKAESATVAGIPPDGWSEKHYRELGARYNGGPYWDSPVARRYGDYLVDHLDQVRTALAD